MNRKKKLEPIIQNSLQYDVPSSKLIYKEPEHETWSIMAKKLMERKEQYFCQEYLECLKKINLNPTKVESLDQLNKKLHKLSGWKVQPVDGLIPLEKYMKLITCKIFPVAYHVRTPKEIEFAELPDYFHDVFGHLPLLCNKKFSDFLINYGEIALKYVDLPEGLKFLGNLLWYTSETGLIRQKQSIKAYGGAIITSESECLNMISHESKRSNFVTSKIMSTPYSHLKLQEHYFIIDSFDELSTIIENIENDIRQQFSIS
ncbi:MAG: hypothetical protein F6J96_32015 [Symploca sp. SIO1C2]|nr:hypothetical protein [Symploca sp. SIO1C2]